MQRAKRVFALTIFLVPGTTVARAADDPAAEPADRVPIDRLDDRCPVLIGGTLFTEYVFSRIRETDLYPIIGPHGSNMTRKRHKSTGSTASMPPPVKSRNRRAL